MDTSSARLLLLLGFFCVLSTTAAAPGYLQLDKLLKGPSYDTNVELEPVKFLLFNRPTGSTLEHNDVTKEFDKINRNLPLVIVLHGFMGSPHAISTQLLIEGYVTKGGNNVVGINWIDLAKGPWYGIAAERCHEAAKQIAMWLTSLVSLKVTTWDKIHIVGFSLGAQVAGLTSKYLPDGIRVGRMTGLDPARPLFDDKSPEDRLDAGDSDFTTIVHTCGGFLAVAEQIGHVDFYPNGGENPQPPCTEDRLNHLLGDFNDSPKSVIDLSDKGPTKIFAGFVCSHYMALALWVESLKPEINFMAKRCPSWKNYLNNTCDENGADNEVKMGENTPRSTRGTYYFKTEANVTYAKTLNKLIADGIQEYSKILSIEGPDKGLGEIEEVTPEIKIFTDPSDKEKYDDGINRIDVSKSSSARNIATFNLNLLLILIAKLRLK